MIRHIVLIRFLPGTYEERIVELWAELHVVCQAIAGVRAFMAGRSESPEQIERGYLHGFTIDFDDGDALRRYSDHSLHREFGRKLIENAVDGLDGILVDLAP